MYNYTLYGWPTLIQAVPCTLRPFFGKRFQLTISNGCLLWGLRVVVPEKYKSQVLSLLHDGHPGMTRMKSLSRLHIWWSSIDADIEETVRQCQHCAENARDPIRVPLHQWEESLRPWQRIHIDLAGPFKGKMWLVLIDVYSKWPEVQAVRQTTTEVIIHHLRKIFAINGLPEIIVSDNGPQFKSEDFKKFCNNRGIQHIFSPPYHPRSNGEVERLVQTFKVGVNKIKAQHNKAVDECVLDFLANYRATPHSSTNQTPSELLNGRRLRTKLDLIHPSQQQLRQESSNRQQRNYSQNTKWRQFQVGDLVWIRNYREGKLWIPGMIKSRQGNVMYHVQQENSNITWR